MDERYEIDERDGHAIPLVLGPGVVAETTLAWLLAPWEFEDRRMVRRTTLDATAAVTLGARGAALPAGLLYGELTPGYEGSGGPEAYVGEVQRRRAHAPRDERSDLLLTASGHGDYLRWFANGQPPGADYREHAAFAMSGLGMLPSEQAKWLQAWQGRGAPVRPRRPSSAYLPRTLPLAVVELARCAAAIEPPGQRGLVCLHRNLRVLALYWHSRRLHFEAGIPIGRLAVSALCKLAGTNRDGAQAALDWLERVRLLHCTDYDVYQRRGTQARISRYLVPAVLRTVRTAPWVVLAEYEPPPLTQAGYNVGRWAELLWQPRQYQLLVPACTRRTLSAELWRKSRSQQPRLWQVEVGSRAAIERVKLTIERKAPTIELDRPRLWRLWFRLRAKRVQVDTTLEREDVDRRLRVCTELLHRGVAAAYSYCRSGRLATKLAASPLTTSRSEGKCGYDEFWGVLQGDLWMVDITAADLLAGAIVSGDRLLFDHYCEGDLYRHLLTSLGLPSDDPRCRKLIKLFTLATTYGAGIGALQAMLAESQLAFSSDLADRFQAHFRQMYGCFGTWLELARGVGYGCLASGKQPLLPNEFPLALRADKPGATPALVLQAEVKLLITRVFERLEDAGADAVLEVHLLITRVFERLEDAGADAVLEVHDAVVTRRPPEAVAVAGAVREGVVKAVERYRRDWPVPAGGVFAKVLSSLWLDGRLPWVTVAS